jgi:biotin transport system substrate-specific component
MPRTALLSPSHASPLAALRSADAALVTQIAGIAVFALLAALGAQVRIYLWEVPITLQTAAVYGAGLFLGGRNGALSMLVYLTLGLFLPVFAGAESGLTYLLGATSTGYLLSYPLVALLIGRMTSANAGLGRLVMASALGALILFASGVVWLHFAAGHTTWAESIYKGFVLFITWDLCKIALVAGGYAGLRRLTDRG